LEEGDTETREYYATAKYYITRTTIVGFIVLASFGLPSNLNLCLSIAGAVLGFIVTILLPVIFYNKAREVSGADAKAAKGELAIDYLNTFVVSLACALAVAGLAQSLVLLEG
tara:strand:- start:228 stop:563 length:336 start_codon:yes stop_codon:yes gene_type:complete